MPNESWAWLIEKVIPSQRGAGRQIIDEVLARLQHHQWGSHDVFSVQLALEEAIVNAIRHGNRMDASKQVHVVCKMSPQRIFIEITDEGPGFDPEQVPDPTDDEHLECPGGRGIMLMRSYMSRVEYNETGNTVVMEKERTDLA
jgi:serine/threonine-protein kinase RsbW